MKQTQTINMLDKKTGRCWASFEMPDDVVQGMKKVARQRGLSTEEMMVIAIEEGLRVDSIFSPETAAIAARLQRDHKVSERAIITAALHQVLQELEEDIAENGWVDGGEHEQYFIADVRRVMSGKPLANRPDLKGYKFGSRSYHDMMRAVAKREQRQLLREAQAPGGLKTRP